MVSGVVGEDALVFQGEKAKLKTSDHATSSNLWMDAASYTVPDDFARPDLVLDEAQKDLLDVQGVVNEAVGDLSLGLSPAVDQDVSRAVPLQLANDSSLMDSVEASPCNPGRHLQRRREATGVRKRDGDDIAGCVGRFLRSLEIQLQGS